MQQHTWFQSIKFSGRLVLLRVAWGLYVSVLFLLINDLLRKATIETYPLGHDSLTHILIQQIVEKLRCFRIKLNLKYLNVYILFIVII